MDIQRDFKEHAATHMKKERMRAFAIIFGGNLNMFTVRKRVILAMALHSHVANIFNLNEFQRKQLENMAS